MKTNHKFDAAYFAAQTLKTRKFGHTYVHAGAPGELEQGEIHFRVSSYGRSLQSGGNKYKVHASRDGKPVPSEELRNLLA